MKKYVLLSLLYVFVLACKNENNVCKYINRKEVCIKLINKSGQDIKLLTVNNGMKKSISNLKDNEEGYISIYSPGESSYKITVIFENGDVIESKGNYVEGGYRMTEIIRQDRIETKSYDFY